MTRNEPSTNSTLALKRFHGLLADEVFMVSRPDPETAGRDFADQARSLYGQIHEVLRLEGGSPGDVLEEVVYFKNIQTEGASALAGRRQALEKLGFGTLYQPATTFIGQAPTLLDVGLEVALRAVVPQGGGSLPSWLVECPVPCRCNDCPTNIARVTRIGGQVQLHAGNVIGCTGPAYQETFSMFESAGALLEKEGMDFRDVMRTWIYLRNMEADYAEFNRARRDYFRREGIDQRPASTGIQGSPSGADHNLTMGFYACKSEGPVGTEVMHTPTLNEAWQYGSDFSRGLKVVEANRIALYISGTASVDEEGRTVHLGDLDAQARRMIRNISTLLQGQAAGLDNLVSAVTYVKRAHDAARMRQILADYGLMNIPNAVVHAEVCRPDLLCEMEGVAVLPL